MDIIIDPDLARTRRLRAAERFDPKFAFLGEIAAEELALRLSAVERRFEDAVVLHGANGDAARAALATGKIDRLTRMDLSPAFSPDRLSESFEDVPLEAGSINLAIAPLYLHLVNDLPGVLIQIRRALRPDGLFLAAIPGAGTLQELNEVLIETEARLYGGSSPRVLPFADIRALGGLLQRAGMTLPVADVETYTVRYASLFSLMQDLRGFGMTNMLAARARRPVSRGFFLEAAKLYQERFGDPDGKIRATFSIVYLSGWAPHESQQKPLKPGSAKHRLADALKAIGQETDKAP